MLVVDDDPEIRRVVASLLIEAGYDAQTAVDGEHALRSAVALGPDLIIIDIHVPEKAMALRFAQAYRDRVPADRRAPLVAVSGAADLEDVGQQLGASGFLKKPFDAEELLKLVAKLLPEPVSDPETVAAAEPEAEAAAALDPVIEPGTAPA